MTAIDWKSVDFRAMPETRLRSTIVDTHLKQKIGIVITAQENGREGGGTVIVTIPTSMVSTTPLLDLKASSGINGKAPHTLSDL